MPADGCWWKKERERYIGKTSLPFLMFSSLGRKFNQKNKNK